MAGRAVNWAAIVWLVANAVRVVVFYAILNRTFVLVVRSVELWYTESTTTMSEGG